MIPQSVIFTLALFGVCAFVFGKPKWGMVLCGPAIWHYFLSPIGWAVLGELPLWVAIPAAIVICIRLSFGMLTQALSVMFGRHIAEEATGHAVGHYLQKSISWLASAVVAMLRWPVRAIWRLGKGD